MKLVIVESPSKAKTIEKYLGKDYKVRASVGHVRDLPKSNKKAIDIKGGFVPHYEISKGKETVVSELKKLSGKANEVLLATDPDREGEAIAWHIKEALDLKKKNTKRVVFHEITKNAVLEAMKHPREIDDDLKQAQEARRVLDRLVGYDLSGLIWKKVRYGLSAGRVQSPALRIIMEKERDIRAFIPEKFWVIEATCKTDKKDIIPFTCVEEPKTEEETNKILKIAKEKNWKVAEVKESDMKRRPKAPFTTSTLQQTASSRLGFSPANTMRIAQKLYEAGLITYMRTDSTTLSKDAISVAKKMINEKYGKDYLEVRTYKTKSKNAQEAHEAVRPTDLSKQSAGKTTDQKRLYSLIWTRTIASQMTDAKLLKTKILAEVEGGKIPQFKANGSQVVFDGWLKADIAARGEDTELPSTKSGDKLVLDKIESEAKETQPPNRYTEAGIVKELEKRGIGRPSTYAATIKNLVDRGYVEKEGRTLIPTDTGDVVSSFLETNFGNIISDTFTADMEDQLDEIATGKRKYKKTLSDFYKPFSKEIEEKDKSIGKITNLGDAPEEFKCPKCSSKMIIKLGKGGKFISCDRFPDCDGALTIDGQEIKPEEPIGKDPESGEDIFLLSGKYGPYVQLGEKTKENPKPKRGSVPKEKDLSTVSVEDALKYLSIPRDLGEHPDTGSSVKAGIGRFGPYIVHDGDFRSLKEDDVYTIKLDRALELLAEEKKPPKGTKIIKKLGAHPKTKKEIVLYESKSGMFLRKGLRRIYLDSDTDIKKLDLDKALEVIAEA